MEAGDLMKAIAAFKSLRNRAPKGTRVRLESTTLLAIAHLRANQSSDAKPLILEVMRDETVIHSAERRKEFRCRAYERFDQEIVLAACRGIGRDSLDIDRIAIDAIRHDPEWKGGDYTTEPQSLRTAAQMLWLVGSNPVIRYRRAPTLTESDKEIDDYVANYIRANDANDTLYALESSRDYDPAPALERIKAPLVAINSADDLVNPPEIGVLEREITRVPNGRAIMIPLSDRTAGHGTHTLAAVWKEYLGALLAATER